MDWLQVLTIAGSNIALFLWARSESRADFRHVLSIIESIKDEMKDFHGKLERLDTEFKAFLMKK